MDVSDNLEPQLLNQDLMVDVDLTEEFQEIEIALCQFDAEGHAPLKIGERPFHWGVIERSCQDLLKKYNDLRVIIWLTRASVHLSGMKGLLEASVLLSNTVSLPQEQLSPRRVVGESDEEVGEMYQIALAWLASDSFLFQLKQMSVSEGFDVTLEGVVFGGDLLELKLAGVLEKALSDLQMLVDSFQKVYEFLGKFTNGEYLFDFHKVLIFYQTVVNSLCLYISETTKSDEVVVNRLDQVTQTNRNYGTPISHDEVRSLIDQLLRYFHHYEPSHPAPILLQRVRRMVGATFEEMMQELYADAKQLVAKIDSPDSVVH